MTYFTPSLFYFLFFGALSCLWPYFALYYTSVGLSGAEIGVLTGLTPLVTMFGGPFWTGLADSTRRHKPVLVFNLFASASLMLVFMQFRLFWPLLLLAALFSFMNAPIASLADSATMSTLGEKKHLYGRVRIWGTIGWGIVAPIGGFLVDLYGVPGAFSLYAALTLAGLLAGLMMTFRVSPRSAAFTQGVGTLLREKRWILFLLMVFVAGVGIATINGYLFVHMSARGLNQNTMGWVLSVSTLFELPVMFFGDRLLKRLGPGRTMLLALFAIAIRLLLYGVSTDAWHFMAINVLHGLTFPLAWLAGVSYASQVAPAGLEATAQGMFASAMMGFGAGAGGFIGGVLLGQIGADGMYLLLGGALLVCALCFIPFLGRRE